MPIAVICPGCDAKLNAPDSAAGKKIKCPKPTCGTMMIVPAPLPTEVEVVDDDPPAPKPRRGKATVAVDDDEDSRPKKRRRDEDDEDDDRPRKKKKKSGGLPPAAIAGIVLGGLLVLGGIGYGVYALVSKKPDTAQTGGGGGGGGGSGGKASIPAGWKEYSYPEDKFKAYFPAPPIKHDDTAIGLALRDKSVKSVRAYLSEQRGTPTIEVTVVRLAPGTTPQQRDGIIAAFNGLSSQGGEMNGPTDVSWMGLPAKQIAIKETGGTAAAVIRYLPTDKAIYFGRVSAFADEGRAKPEEENGFFDNCELLKSDPPNTSGAGGGGNDPRKKAPAPLGWIPYSFETTDRFRFRVWLPRPIGQGRKPSGEKVQPGEKTPPGVAFVDFYSAAPIETDRRIMGVIAITFKTDATAAEKENAMAIYLQQLIPSEGVKVSKPQLIIWTDRESQEITVEDTGPGNKGGAKAIRYFISETRGWISFIGTDTKGRAKPEEENGFLDSLILLK